MTKEDWIKELKENKAWSYIKPNRRIHDSGYRCFEVGYLTMGDGLKIKGKLVLGEYVDHVQTCGYGYENNPFFQANMDLLKDGYIRFYSHKHTFWWGMFDFAISSMTLEILSDIERS